MDDFYLDGGKYFIPKNINIVVDVLSIHYDNVLWGPIDPEIFYPLRFTQERNPASWLAFGWILFVIFSRIDSSLSTYQVALIL